MNNIVTAICAACFPCVVLIQLAFSITSCVLSMIFGRGFKMGGFN